MSELNLSELVWALLVSLDGNGSLIAKPIANGKSVLNLETELQDHLSSQPFSDEFLLGLRDYCAGRLEARAAAKATGGVCMARPGGFNIVHVNTRGVQ